MTFALDELGKAKSASSFMLPVPLSIWKTWIWKIWRWTRCMGCMNFQIGGTGFRPEILQNLYNW